MADTILQIFERKGHSYLLVDHGNSFAWADAEAHAQSLGSHLATINDATEQADVYGAFAEAGSAISASKGATWLWLGYNDVDVEGSFEWASGEKASYTNWFPGQPNANNIPNQDYAAYFFVTGFDPKGQWFTIPDDDPNNYALALIELPGLLSTAGDDVIAGGEWNDVISGGKGDDQLGGYNGDDTLNGGDGDDYLHGGTGDDVLRGGTGDDIYDIAELSGFENDTIIERRGEGIDTIYEHVIEGFVMPDNVENFLARSSNFSAVSGNKLANRMDGSADGDSFEGMGGRDVLNGGGGDDDLDGGEGNDKLNGGNGNDGLFGGDGNDVLTGGKGIDRFTTFGGNDRVVFKSVDEIGKGATSSEREGIAHFDTGDHIIDLSAIDANGAAAGDGAFDFIAAAKFSKTAGELRAQEFTGGGSASNYVLIEGDVTGDGKADFRFQLDNILSGPDNFELAADDFRL